MLNNAFPRKAEGRTFPLLMVLAAGNAASIVKAIALSKSIHHRNVPQIQYIGSRGAPVVLAKFPHFHVAS